MGPAIYSLSTSTRKLVLKRADSNEPLVLGLGDEQSIGAGQRRTYLGSSQKLWV